jgi:hypothetical protein
MGLVPVGTVVCAKNLTLILDESRSDMAIPLVVVDETG